jgi:hypothetical protein
MSPEGTSCLDYDAVKLVLLAGGLATRLRHVVALRLWLWLSRLRLSRPERGLEQFG